MTDKAMSPLRRRMIEDMTIRKFAPKTQTSYIRAVRNFTVFLGRSPDQASAEDLRRYQLHLAASGVAVPSQNAAVTALRFFFAVTLGRSEVTDRMPFVREPLPAPIADIAYQNKAAVYAILFQAAAETLITIAADPQHLGARLGLTAVLHTWGSALTHHPHVHCIVPGGGLSSACPGQRSGGERWISCRPGFFLPVRVLSRLFRRLFLEKLTAAHDAGRLRFFNDLASLEDRDAFAAYLTPSRKVEWVVYAKRPFAGPAAVLAYLSRYTHRVAIANSRLIALDDNGVTFKWKDYRAKGRDRHKVMTLASDEFIRRFLIHTLPDGFHRIRHYGLFANGGRAENLARARELLCASPTQSEFSDTDANEPPMHPLPCPCCGGRMIIIETFDRGSTLRTPPSSPVRIDTS